MNPRVEKLCLPRRRRDAIWKFWQPNAKLEKIDSPVYWKPLNYKEIHRKKKTIAEKLTQNCERSCSDAYNYKTLIYKRASDKRLTGKAFRIFIDYEHNELYNNTWKESLEREHLSANKLKMTDYLIDKPSINEISWSNVIDKQEFVNDQYLKRQEMNRYFKSHISKDNLFELDKSPYPSLSMPISRRPRDALHIDFYQSACFEGSKTEATYKTFYHRKYLLSRRIRENTLKDLISIADDAQLDIDIIGHFILHPNELSKHEIKMFELTSDFGDIYEGHIIRIKHEENTEEKLVLLLASAHHSDVKLATREDLKNIIEDPAHLDARIDPQSTVERIVIDHIREYFQANDVYSVEQIRRIQIEFEPLTNQEKRRVIVHLLTDEENIETLTFEITHEQEPKLFDINSEENLYFIQGIDEQTILHSTEDKLERLFHQRYSLTHQEENTNSYLQSTLDIEYDTINSIQKKFYAYAGHTLTVYSREECMRIAIEYSFDDLLDKLDSNEFQSINDDKERDKQIQMMMHDIQTRFRSQIEQRLKAEATAKILLIGPPIKKEIESIGKEVIVLDHHREIFIAQSDTYLGPSKMKNIQRNSGNIIFHEEIDGGPKSFDRLPMSIDSLTILTRIQQRQRLAIEQSDNNLILLGNGIRRFITSDEQESHKQNVSLSIECEQDKTEKKISSHFSLDKDDSHSLKTLNTNTKSYNTSAYTKQQHLREFYSDKQYRKKKRMSRSPVDHGKHRQKRKRHTRYELASEVFINPKRSFLNNLLLLRQNQKEKMMIITRNHNRKKKCSKLIKDKNVNAVNEKLNKTKNLQINLFTQLKENSLSMDSQLLHDSMQSNELDSVGEQRVQIEHLPHTTDVIIDSDLPRLEHDNNNRQDLHVNTSSKSSYPNYRPDITEVTDEDLSEYPSDIHPHQSLFDQSITSTQEVWTNIGKLVKQSLANRKLHIDLKEMNDEQMSELHDAIANEKDLNNDESEKYKNLNKTTGRDEPIEQKDSQDEGFQDKEDDDDIEDSTKSDDTERNLRSLYGSLSSAMKHVHEMYQSKSSQLMSSLDLAHIFITFLHMRKDMAYDIASTIVAARQRLVRPISIKKSLFNTINEKNSMSKTNISQKNGDDDASVSSGIITADDSDTISSEERSIDNDDEDQDDFIDVVERKKYDLNKNKIISSSNSQSIMSRMTTYLSEADWRVFNYITKHFLKNGVMITSHALEFSSALLIDLIEDSVYQTYFHSKWCTDSYVNLKKEQKSIENAAIEEFLKKSIDHLFNRLQLINSPLLESIALMHSLKNNIGTDLLQELSSMKYHPVPITRDPCVWFSTDILIKTICSLTDDILNHLNHDYLSDYAKFEYLLISYFRKVQIVRNLQDDIDKSQDETIWRSSHSFTNIKCLLHVIDLKQAPKFFSDQAFKRFKFSEHSQLNGDIEALKDLVLLDIKKRNVKSVKRPYLPLSINDLLIHHQNRVLSPSPWILAQYHRRLGAQKIPSDEDNIRKDSYRFDANIDPTNLDNLAPEVRALLDNMIKQYSTMEENLAMQSTRELHEGLKEEDVAQLIENAIEAVERFDREHNIGERKLHNKKTVNDRLTEFFKHAGRYGVRLLDDVLKLAKLRSNDPKKYLPIAINMLKDRLKSSGTTRQRKQAVRFAHTLETLLTATNDEPDLITAMLNRKSDAKKSSVFSKYSGEALITDLDALRMLSGEVDETIDYSSVEPVISTNDQLHSSSMSLTGKYRQTLPVIDEAIESTIPSSDSIKLDDEFDPQALASIPIILNIGLTVAQLTVLAAGTISPNHKPFKLTSIQIEQMCLKQGLSSKQLQVDAEKLMETAKISDNFKLTEEQLVQIATEEKIPIVQVEHISTSQHTFRLNEDQRKSLIAQINMVNRTSISSILSLEQQQLPLVLHLDQLIELCNQQNIDLDRLIENETASQNSPSFINSKDKFSLSSVQIAHLINQNNFDIKKLLAIERHLQEQGNQAQQFRLSPSQFACLFANHHIIQSDEVFGLSAAQLIGLYVLQQQSIRHNETSLFSLTYQQIKQLALMQNMNSKHFLSLRGSKKQLQLARSQLIHIAVENKIPIKQIVALHNDQKSKVLDREQLCAIISQNNQSVMMQKSVRTTQSNDESPHIEQRAYLDVEQIFSLAKYSNITLDQMATCSTKHTDVVKFRFKPEQLAMLWDTSNLSDDHEHVKSLPESQSPFILSDEQFNCLLGSLSTSVLEIHSRLTTIVESNLELKSQNIPITPQQLIEIDAQINTQKVSTDKKSLIPSPLTDQLTAMHERLRSSAQSQIETVKIVSNSMLKRDRIESTLHIVHQLSLHSIDDISTKEIETIPSIVFDLLKMDPMTDSVYKSIQQDGITPDLSDKSDQLASKSNEVVDLIANGKLNKTIIEGIQVHQLTLPQIHKIQTQFLTPKLIEEFKSDRLSQRILDAYKSLSPLQIINKVRSSATQLSTLLLQQSPINFQSSLFDSATVSSMPQTSAKNIFTDDNVFDIGAATLEKQISHAGHLNILSGTTQQDPIIIYPESATIRQQVLQELRDRLDSQLIELKKEYGIEPIKGKASIRQITDKLRTVTAIEELQSSIDRQIDEIDILNILEGNVSSLINGVRIDTNKTKELFHHNTQHRLNRINERIQLVNILHNHIEDERLKRQMSFEEFTALVLEDIPKFEQLTNIHLTEDDLRIISMNRFAAVERSMTRRLTESEYRQLLETSPAFDYTEQKLLNRSLTPEERIEQEELALLPYHELFANSASILHGKITESLEQQNIKPTREQLEQTLRRRAELVDQYDIIHSISPSIEPIERQLDRSLTMNEKKRLIQDDYSMIKRTKSKNMERKTQEILPITASVIELVENTQDKNLLENIKLLETDIGRSLTKQEIIMAAKGDIIGLEKVFDKSLTSEIIKSMYNNRFIYLKNELNRHLTDKEIRDVLSGKLSGIEQALSRQLTSTERLTYKSVNVIDLTASQLTTRSSINTTVKELEDVLERRLTSHEIEYLTNQHMNLIGTELSSDKLESLLQHESNVHEEERTHLETLKDNYNEDSFIFGPLLKQPIHFILPEIESAIEKRLSSDELERFAGSHFVQIEHDLGKPLNDIQRSNLLKGDKLTIESLISRKLSPEETGPHSVNITNIERILNRSLTLDELTYLAGDRFDEIHQILQRPFNREELIDLLNGTYKTIVKTIENELNKQKENELKELPINRIRYFENILNRKLSSQELVRFAEDRFKPLLRLLSDAMKPEQILDIASGHYDRIETFFNRSLTQKEKYELEKTILQTHIKYPNILDELEYIIQRRLNERELRTLAGDQYHEIEMRLGKSLNESQLRNILQGKYDHSLIGVEDLLNRLIKKHEDNQKRTQNVATRLIDMMNEDYTDHSIVIKSSKLSIPRTSIRQKQSDIEFDKTAGTLLELLSDDVRKHVVGTQRDSLLDLSSRNDLKKDEQSLFSPSRESQGTSPIREEQQIKAFENIPRLVEQIADKEHIEDRTTVTNAIDKFREVSSEIEQSNNDQRTSSWLSNLNKDVTISPRLPVIKSLVDKTATRSPLIHTDEDLYLGWTLFKGADRQDIGLKEEKPRMINVKHLAQTYVVGIPEEYADEKSESIAKKIYRGEYIPQRLRKSQIIKEMSEFVSQLFHMPMISDATHFIVPSRAYVDVIEPVETYESEMINIEDDELQMRDSPETIEWYEECIQRNVQVHAQIPLGYQPSIVYCHTGRRTVITPAKRAEQRKASTIDFMEKSKTVFDLPEFSLNNTFMERLNQPIFDNQSIESTTTAQTVTDLIMHTVTMSQKTDLLEALEELFSEENLDKYQMTETHWQDIFLILLNSYLRSNSLNRKEIFKRLTDKLYELRKKERRRSSNLFPNISIVSPPSIATTNSMNESTKKKQFHFGLRSSFGSLNSGQSPNDSATLGRQSIASHESVLSPSNNDSSTKSLSHNHSATSTSRIITHDLVNKTSSQSRLNIDQISTSPSEKKSSLQINSNAITNHQQCSSGSIKDRRYKITVMHNDELSINMPSISTKLPPIASKNRSSQSSSTTLSNQTTPGGIAAAITTARASPTFSIAIMEPTSYIGGMSTAGGIGLRDLGLEDTIAGSVAYEWVQNNNKYYKRNATNSVYQPDMNISRQSFLDILSVHSNIELITETGPVVPVSLQMNGTRILQIATTNSRKIWKASVWIDASYEGDLVRFSGASYTWGRESRDQYGEPDAGVLPYSTFANFLPDYPVNATLDNGTLAPYISSDKLGSISSADFNMMGYSYRLCITPTKEKQTPFVKPINYNENNFVIFQRYIDSLVQSGKYPIGPPIEMLTSVLIYRGYPAGDKFDMCDSFGSAFTSDAINLNRNYVNGTTEDRQRIAQIVSDYVLGMLWYILTSPHVPEHTRSSLTRYGLCNDQWPENRHIPPQLYVREGLRLVNENVFTQNHIRSGLCRNDTIALGSWRHDVHVVTRTANETHVNNEGAMFKDIAQVKGSKSGPAFEIPYSVLLPKRNEVTNLLVPVCHAVSHIAFAATRVEPHFMLLGGAAGYAAAYSILNGNIDVQTVNISRIQDTLVKDGVLLHYPKGHCDM